MSDELLLTEIAKLLHRFRGKTVTAWESLQPSVKRERLADATQVLAKAKQHNEQKRDPFMSFLSHDYPEKARVLKRLKNQKRLDRPDRESFLTDLRLLEERKTSPEWIAMKYLALIPDIEELDKIREEITRLNKKLDDREEDLITAKREERERIVAIASFTVKLEGNTVVVDKYDWDRLWQALQGETDDKV